MQEPLPTDYNTVCMDANTEGNLMPSSTHLRLLAVCGFQYLRLVQRDLLPVCPTFVGRHGELLIDAENRSI